MTGKELVTLIAKFNAWDMHLAVGCEGYVNADGRLGMKIEFELSDGYIFLHDNCRYKGGVESCIKI